MLDREGVGLQQGFFGLQQVLGAHGKAPQAQLQVLGGVGRVAHGKAADRHRDIALFGGAHHHPDELFHGFAGRAVVVLRRSQLPVHRVGILGQVVGADDEEAAAMGHKFFRRQAGRGHTEHDAERGIRSGPRAAARMRAQICVSNWRGLRRLLRMPRRPSLEDCRPW